MTCLNLKFKLKEFKKIPDSILVVKVIQLFYHINIFVFLFSLV
jgi:hypothetical protein